MSQDTAQLLSAELLAVAHALRNVRTRLGQLLAAGHWPEGAFSDITIVQVHGVDVAEALERLANGNKPAHGTPSPYDPDMRM